MFALSLANHIVVKMDGFIIVLKSILSVGLLFCGLLLATMAHTGSLDWIYSPTAGNSPFMNCPNKAQLFNSYSVLDGSACELRFTFTSFSEFDKSVREAFQPHNMQTSGKLRCFQGGAYTECSAGAPCKVSCFSSTACSHSVGSGGCSSNGLMWGSEYADPSLVNSNCAQTISLNGISYPVTGSGISAEPLCGPDMDLTPGMIQTIRGEIVAIGLIGILVFISLFVKSRIAPPTRTKATTQKGMMISKSSAYELRVAVERKWDTSAQNVHPAKFFAASSWKYRVRVMHAMLRKRSARLRKSHIIQATFTSLFLLLSSFLLSLLLLRILSFNVFVPSTSSGIGDMASLWSPLYTDAPFFSGVWIDSFVLADIAVEFLLVFAATVAGLRWLPLPPQRELARQAQTGVTEEACLVLLVSAGSCLRSSGRDKLVSAIETGIKKLNIGAVFVVDMGASMAPLDDSWKIAQSTDPTGKLVHYVYLPDTNKRLGEYWLSEIWIPFLFKSGRIGRLFKQMLVVDLDAVPKNTDVVDVGVLSKLLMLADGNIDDNCGTVVLMPVKSTLPGWAGKWESNRLERDYYSRMLECGVTGGLVTSLSPSTAVNIVDRRTLEVLAPSDPVQLALAATKKRGKVNISAPSEMHAIGIQNTVYDFYVSQSRVVGNSFSLFRELLFAPSSFAHGQSLALKILILLGPVLNLFVGLVRPLILGSLLFRDPLALVLMLAAFWILSVLISCMHAVNQWRSGRAKDLSASIGNILTYPIYQIYLGVVSLGLVVGGATFGRLDDEISRPSVGNHKELYPCLPHADVDWFTCWKTSDATRLSVLNAAVDSDSPRLLSFSNDSSIV